MKFLRMGFPWDLFPTWPFAGIMDSSIVPFLLGCQLWQRPEPVRAPPPQCIEDVFDLNQLGECTIFPKHANPIGGVHGGCAMIMCEHFLTSNSQSAAATGGRKRALKRISARFLGAAKATTKGRRVMLELRKKPRVFDGTLGGSGEIALSGSCGSGDSREPFVLCDVRWVDHDDAR